MSPSWVQEDLLVTSFSLSNRKTCSWCISCDVCVQQWDSLASHALLGCYWLGLQVASAILRDSCARGYGGEW